jgi:hypothetical protein
MKKLAGPDSFFFCKLRPKLIPELDSSHIWLSHATFVVDVETRWRKKLLLQDDNELATLEVIHRYVELLDKYFGSVSHLLI